VRGDLFNKWQYSWFLKNTNQIPIYRFRDGFKRLRENGSTRSIITEKLRKNACVMIFGEGSSETVKFLRPLQKGMARMAHDAVLEDPELDIRIVPLGITFVDPDGFRKNVMIKVGESFAFNEYKKYFDENPALGRKKVTDNLKGLMTPLLLNVTREEEKFYDVASPILRNEMPEKWLPIIEDSSANFDAENQMMEKIRTGKWDAEINTYKGLLKKMGTRDRYLSSRSPFFISLIISIILLPIAAVGFVLNAITSGLTFLITYTIIPRNRFFGSLAGLSRLGLHWYILYPIITIVGFFKVSWPALFFIPVAVITEWIFYRWWDHFLTIVHKTKIAILHSSTLAQAKEKRALLYQALK
jgi:hypothetical protein